MTRIGTASTRSIYPIEGQYREPRTYYGNRLHWPGLEPPQSVHRDAVRRSSFTKPERPCSGRLAESIADERFERCRIAIAFAQSEAVETVQRQLSDTIHEIETEIYAGIDFGSTSAEALEALAESDIETTLFIHNQFTYHPKLYHFVSPDFTRTIIGSSNLTAQGLNQNVEAAVVVETEGDGLFLKNLSQFLDCIAELGTPLTPELIADLVGAGPFRHRQLATRAMVIPAATVMSHLTILPDGLLAESSIQGLDEAFGARNNTSDSSEGDSTDPAASDSVPDSPAELELPPRSEMPPIPDPVSLDTTTKQNYYSQLVNDAANQPSRMRRLIRSRGEITQGELKRIFSETYGYSISGSFGASLNVLTEVTKEVRAEGEGPERRLIWIGK